jgi:ribosome-associated translation inhibitor RaiA
MRIEVLADDTISQQARTYAEYRIFAALTQIAGAGQIQDARVVLCRTDGGGNAERVTCIVTVPGSRSIHAWTTADHPYAAINRVVEDLRKHRAHGVVRGARESLHSSDEQLA